MAWPPVPTNAKLWGRYANGPSQTLFLLCIKEVPREKKAVWTSRLVPSSAYIISLMFDTILKVYIKTSQAVFINAVTLSPEHHRVKIEQTSQCQVELIIHTNTKPRNSLAVSIKECNCIRYWIVPFTFLPQLTSLILILVPPPPQAKIFLVVSNFGYAFSDIPYELHVQLFIRSWISPV
jgi:hypothetical protein